MGAAAAIVSALLVAGCAPAEAGAAAVIGDRRISVAEVQSAYNGILALAGPDAGITQDVILDDLILEPYLVQAASDLGRGVSLHDAELQFQIDASMPKPSVPALAVMRALAANTQIQGDRSQAEYTQTYQQISTKLRADGVHINPRFGSSLDLDPSSPTHLQILAEQPNWLAKPATPAPSVPPAGSSQPETSPTP
jgi:hypothetical protein